MQKSLTKTATTAMTMQVKCWLLYTGTVHWPRLVTPSRANKSQRCLCFDHSWDKIFRMNLDAQKKSALLTSWYEDFLPSHTVCLFDRLSRFDRTTAISRLANLPTKPSIYILFVTEQDCFVPVYIGKADSPLLRWGQHLEGWSKGAGSYARWRAALLDTDGRANADLTLLVIPLDEIKQPPIPGFPVSLGTVEYQLVGLASDAFPGRLLNSEGRGRC